MLDDIPGVLPARDRRGEGGQALVEEVALRIGDQVPAGHLHAAQRHAQRHDELVGVEDLGVPVAGQDALQLEPDGARPGRRLGVPDVRPVLGVEPRLVGGAHGIVPASGGEGGNSVGIQGRPQPPVS
ncbi:hypothetical protein [Streptomyces sp. NPDC006463]|uniref:hypothetical protein n=1 Tax=Streptomyces sp. NPDC006463 TaxID=3364746 RepID=UPI003680F26E